MNIPVKEQLTIWWLCRMCNWLKGGAGHGERLLGGSGPSNLFPKGLRQPTLQELPARPELLVILGVF